MSTPYIITSAYLEYTGYEATRILAVINTICGKLIKRHQQRDVFSKPKNVLVTEVYKP